MDELKQIQTEIVQWTAKMAESEEKGDREFLLIYGKMLVMAKEKELMLQRKSPSAETVSEYNSVVDRCRKYMMHSLLTEITPGIYEDGKVKSCVTVATCNVAFMAAHCLPRNIPRNFEFKVYDVDENSYPVKIAYIEQYDEGDEEYKDFAILEIEKGTFPFSPSNILIPKIGNSYFVLGYDGDYQLSRKLSCFAGVFRNVCVSPSDNFIIGSPGTTSGCSGGGVFSMIGDLYGICVSGRLKTSSMSMPLHEHLQTLEIKLGEPSYSHIVPAAYLVWYMPAWKKGFNKGIVTAKNSSSHV